MGKKNFWLVLCIKRNSVISDGNDDVASLDEGNDSDGGSILDEVIRNNEESYHH